MPSALHLVTFLRGEAQQHHEVAEILIEKGADVNALNQSGCTPLHYCVFSRAVKIAKVLIKHGCKLDTVSSIDYEDQKTPLLASICDVDDVEMVELLINAGANLDVGNSQMKTPLILVAYRSRTDIAKMLIQGGCDINKCYKDDISPFQASLFQFTPLTRMLVLAGCTFTLSDRAALDKVECIYNAQELTEYKTWLIEAFNRGPNLQQLCRMAIRKSLGQLPNRKIEFLSLPVRLQNYVAMYELDELLK